MPWKTYIEAETFDRERFAKTMVKDAQEGVKSERRKLWWILKAEKVQSEAGGNETN